MAWWRECLLGDAVPLLANLDAAPESERRRLALLLDEMPGVVVATSGQNGPELGLRRPLVRVPVAVPAAVTRRELWKRALGRDAAKIDLDLIARRYRTGASGIARAVTAARFLVSGDGVLDTSAVIGGVRASVEERLGELATRVPVTQSWDDLVLPDDLLDQIKALVARVRHAHRVLDQWGFGRKLARGQGVAALLSGPPGTGKTMVAGLIARELELDLLQVDLSRVVSKWVGETEKQLSALFDAAEAGHALLLFDEADSLFAKRTEIKGANDRYANLEVNYLLQRVEAFGGITLLTTNFETAIDPALRRRLAAQIAFWPPGDAERTMLWRKAIPPEAPVAGLLDHESLSLRYPNMTGANIRNAAIAAAFLAAGEDVALTQDHLERAARVEYQAMGRVLSGRPSEEQA
jgi:SpoVK/Ycf46/Vps4 family AAA+-type ATPase